MGPVLGARVDAAGVGNSFAVGTQSTHAVASKGRPTLRPDAWGTRQCIENGVPEVSMTFCDISVYFSRPPT